MGIALLNPSYELDIAALEKIKRGEDPSD